MEDTAPSSQPVQKSGRSQCAIFSIEPHTTDFARDERMTLNENSRILQQIASALSNTTNHEKDRQIFQIYAAYTEFAEKLSKLQITNSKKEADLKRISTDYQAMLDSYNKSKQILSIQSKLQSKFQSSSIQALVSSILASEKEISSVLPLDRPSKLTDLRQSARPDPVKAVFLLDLNFCRLEESVYALRRQLLNCDNNYSLTEKISTDYGSCLALFGRYKALLEENAKLKSNEVLFQADPVGKRRPFSDVPNRVARQLAVLLQKALAFPFSIPPPPAPKNPVNLEGVLSDTDFTVLPPTSMDEVAKLKADVASLEEQATSLTEKVLPLRKISIPSEADSSSRLKKEVAQYELISEKVTQLADRIDASDKENDNMLKKAESLLLERNNLENGYLNGLRPYNDLMKDQRELFEQKFRNSEICLTLVKLISAFGTELSVSDDCRNTRMKSHIVSEFEIKEPVTLKQAVPISKSKILKQQSQSRIVRPGKGMFQHMQEIKSKAVVVKPDTPLLSVKSTILPDVKKPKRRDVYQRMVAFVAMSKSIEIAGEVLNNQNHYGEEIRKKLLAITNILTDEMRRNIDNYGSIFNGGIGKIQTLNEQILRKKKESVETQTIFNDFAEAETQTDESLKKKKK